MKRPKGNPIVAIESAKDKLSSLAVILKHNSSSTDELLKLIEDSKKELDLALENIK